MGIAGFAVGTALMVTEVLIVTDDGVRRAVGPNLGCGHPPLKTMPRASPTWEVRR